MIQQRHKDFQDFNMQLNASEKPTSTIVALCDGTELHFYIGAEKRQVTVCMSAGDIVIFAGDVLHAGAGWAGQNFNYRLFSYWPTPDIFVPWAAKTAFETLGSKVETFRVANTRQVYDTLKLTTNPLSQSFSLQEYNKYLYDFEQHAFYRFDTELYLLGIGANIDGHMGNPPLVAHYAEMHIEQKKRPQDCPHFNAMTFIDAKHLSKCRKRCFYCMRHERHKNVTVEKFTPTLPCQHKNLHRNKVKKSIEKIHRFMKRIEEQLNVIKHNMK